MPALSRKPRQLRLAPRTSWRPCAEPGPESSEFVAAWWPARTKRVVGEKSLLSRTWMLLLLRSSPAEDRSNWSKAFLPMAVIKVSSYFRWRPGRLGPFARQPKQSNPVQCGLEGLCSGPPSRFESCCKAAGKDPILFNVDWKVFVEDLLADFGVFTKRPEQIQSRSTWIRRFF